MRTSQILAAVVATLVLSASATAVHAAWDARAELPPGVAKAGDLTVSAQWVGGTPSASALFPGQTTAPTMLRITSSGVGTTLSWRIKVALAVAPQFQPYVTLDARASTCGTGTPIPAGGYPATGGFSVPTTTDVCITLTLSPTAPLSLSGQQMHPVLTVDAVQRSS